MEKYLLYSRLEHTKLKFPHFPTSHFLGRLLFFSLGHLHRPLLEFKSLYKKFGLTKLTKLFKKKRSQVCFFKNRILVLCFLLKAPKNQEEVILLH